MQFLLDVASEHFASSSLVSGGLQLLTVFQTTTRDSNPPDTCLFLKKKNHSFSKFSEVLLVFKLQCCLFKF